MRKLKYCLLSLFAVVFCAATVFMAACDMPNTEKQLKSIEVSYTGGAVAHNTEVKDLTGITVTAKYETGNDETLTKNDYKLFGTLVPGTQSQVLVIYKDKTAEFSVTVNAVPAPAPEVFGYVADVNGEHFNTFAEAVTYANAHPYSEVLIVGTVESGDYSLNESVAIAGHADAPVLNGVRFNVKTDKTICFSNLKFSGDSNITTVQGADVTGVLSVDNCYADVQTYQSGKGEFIHPIQGYGFKSDLYLTNSTIIYSGNNDDATQAIWGDGNIRNAVITGNTFGTPEKRMSRYVFKFMRVEEGGTVDISHNVVYGTTTDEEPFAVLNISDRNSANIARITLAYNELDVTVLGSQPVYLGLFERYKIAEINIKSNKLGGSRFSEIYVEPYDPANPGKAYCTVTQTNNYDEATV